MRMEDLLEKGRAGNTSIKRLKKLPIKSFLGKLLGRVSITKSHKNLRVPSPLMVKKARKRVRKVAMRLRKE